MTYSMPGTVSLLYVEDDPATRETVARMLEKNGFNCIVAENGWQGLELYRRYTPDIVLSDIVMPAMSGLDMARNIRKDYPEAQFIFMTALGESKSILQAIEIGITGYVVKPADLSKLLAAITQCVATTRLKEEAQRSRQLEAISILAGGLAHDFNNLLQIVLGNVSLAKKRVEPHSKAYAYLKEAESVAKDARTLGKQLGTLARGESGAKQKTPLAPTLLYSVQAALSGTSTQASFDLPPGIPQVSVDRLQMEQVFSHLTVNAVEAMPGGGKLEVSACLRSLSAGSGALLPPGDYVCITFKDNGKGIPAKNLPKIFDPYFTTKEMDFNKGRGLGLSVCHAIVSRHGGLIRADNSPGAGATIRIWLPVAGEEGEPGSPAAARSTP
jgi:signal transduction histidine kinase